MRRFGSLRSRHDVHHTSHMRWHYLAWLPFQLEPDGRSEVARRSVPLYLLLHYGAKLAK
jgi:hypothetical protein